MNVEFRGHNEDEPGMLDISKKRMLLGLIVKAYGDGTDINTSKRDGAREELRKMGIDTSEVEKNLPLDRPLLGDIVNNYEKQLIALEEKNGKS